MREPSVTPETYARWRETTLGAITERVEVRTVLELAGPVAGRRLLDVGTGDGTYAIEAASRGAAATGLDADPRMLAAAARRVASRGVSVDLLRGSAEALPFEDRSFDRVVAVAVLCFVADPPAAVREMARVLAPGGRLVIGELGRGSAWAAERRVRGWLGESAWRRARFWSPSELRRLVRDADLRVEAERGCVYYPKSALAARVLSPLEPLLARLALPGAAFRAISGRAPARTPPAMADGAALCFHRPP